MSQGVSRDMWRRTENLQSTANLAVVQVRSMEGELQQHAAAGLDDPPTVLSYLRFDEGAQMVLELDDKLAVGAERDAFGQGADLGLAQLVHLLAVGLEQHRNRMVVAEKGVVRHGAAGAVGATRHNRPSGLPPDLPARPPPPPGRPHAADRASCR